MKRGSGLKEYYGYIEDVRSGKVRASIYIKQMVERLEKMKQRSDIFFDEAAVEDCFEFIKHIKHFAGKAAGKHFELMPWQKWVIGSVIGIKHKDSGLRVCRELFVLVARKNGKTALIAALSLYLMIADGEASPSIGCVAASRDQARILFETAQQYAKSLDPKNSQIKNFRNYIKFIPNNGEFKVFSSDSSNLDGLSLSTAILDEGHAQKDNLLYSVLKSSMGFRQQPLMVQITTAGFLLEGYPCFETYKVSIEILAGVKEQDEFFPFLYVLDNEDDWTDEENWIKCNPCLDVTITRDYLRDQVKAAENDTTQETPIKTKNFNIWMNSSMQWISQDIIARQMRKVNIEDYAGYTCYLAVDLSSVGDFTALSCMIPDGDKFIYKTWCFLPEESLKDHPNKVLYERFIQEGSLTLTPGNVCDFDYIINKIAEINKILHIEGVYYDSWNSSFFTIKCTELGYNMIPVSQAVGSFNAPTKEFERWARDGKLVIDKSSNILWEFGCVVLKMDHNGNVKPSKESYQSKKIDGIIAMLMCAAGWMKNPVASDFTIFSLP